jgi:chemotaxis protein CheX
MKQENKMDVRFINPFIAAINNVFKTMLNTGVTIGKPMLKNAVLESADVSGVIGLSGDVQGCVVLSFPRLVARKVAPTFASTDLDIGHPDFADAIGELANMVAGNAKKDFTGYKVSISLPSVITGAGHSVSQSKASPFLIIPCETAMGPFNVEVALLTNKSPVSAGEPAVAGAR